MLGLWGKQGEKRASVSAEFSHALMQQVLRTELIRIKALIATTAVLGLMLLGLYLFDPYAINHLWHGHLTPAYLYAVLIPFILFELWVHRNISCFLRLDRDVPLFWRYLGALIETSMPTIALALHIDSMGRIEALGFVVPFTYFIFIILSTLRQDFWLSTFTGFVAAAELFYMAMFYQAAGGTEPPPDLYYHSVRSVVVLICGMLAGAVGVQLRRQFEASILAATVRDRVTNLFGQHVSPQVVERLMAEGAAGGSEIRRVAVMFVDFRSFTAGASTRSPREVVDRLDGAFAAGRHSRPPWRHREQIPRRWIPGAVRCAAGGAGRRVPRGRRRARNAGGERARQPQDQLAAAHRHRHPFRRSGRRQYRLAPAQGIYRDRRHREFCEPARSAQQGIQFAAIGVGCGPRRARRSLRRCETAWRGRGPRL
jgi:hypothetical protein